MEPIVESVWGKSKLLIKTGIIAIILLLLQIPGYYVTQLINEREARQKEAIAEVSSKWAGKQNIIAPVLVVPYRDSATGNNKHLAYFLPSSLIIDAKLTPQEKYRGIYKVMLYTTQVKLSGSFDAADPQKLGIAAADMRWNEAYIRMSVTDNRGLNEELKLTVNDSALLLSPFGTTADADGLKASLPASVQPATQAINFATTFTVNGSGQLLFTPLGRSTSVTLQSAWPHPSFIGNSLPQSTTVNDTGFTANWRSMGFKQPFPQQWKDDEYNVRSYVTGNSVSSAAFGADLFIPVNDYQKTARSIKYSLLCLALTFAAFFLIETTNKKSAHPFQYGLIGLALILFYTLLLSISEYLGFNAAYVIASVCTIALIGWFVTGILTSGRLAVWLSVILVLLYGYVFTILQLQDSSLLLGSIGLFLALAVIMRYSKKIHW